MFENWSQRSAPRANLCNSESSSISVSQFPPLMVLNAFVACTGRHSAENNQWWQDMHGLIGTWLSADNICRQSPFGKVRSELLLSPQALELSPIMLACNIKMMSFPTICIWELLIGTQFNFFFFLLWVDPNFLFLLFCYDLQLKKYKIK